MTHFAGTVGVLGTLTTFVDRFDGPFGPHDFSPFPYDVYWAGPLALLTLLAIPLGWWVSRSRSPLSVSLVGCVVMLRAESLVGQAIERAGSRFHSTEPLIYAVNPLSLLEGDGTGSVFVCGLGAVVLGFPPLVALPARWANQCTGVDAFERVCFRAAALLAGASLLALPISMIYGPRLPILSLVVAAGVAALGLWQRQLRRRLFVVR